MSYKSKVDFIRDTLTDLSTSVEFFHMRDFDFEQVQQRRKFVVLLSPLVKTMISNGTNSYMDQSSLRFKFLKKTKTDDNEQETLTAIDECGKLADEFVRLFHWNVKNADRLDTSQGINFVSAVTNEVIINEMAEILTGIDMIHEVVFPDDFNYCEEC